MKVLAAFWYECEVIRWKVILGNRTTERGEIVVYNGAT